mmetsp:Transcript_14932/g.18931  ORF Transcript_14932/g.18931 Transcript_14932/m.18931 type:complete len:170 (-) Transcript_14932:158-667(-)
MRSFRRQKISNSTMISPRDNNPKSASPDHAYDNTGPVGVSIHEPIDGNVSSCYSVQYSDDEQISRSAMYMYDAATWRMYNRIMADRRRRAEIAERLNIASDLVHSHYGTTAATAAARSKKHTSSAAEQVPAVTACVSEESASKSSSPQASRRSSELSPYREDEIFDLEL